MKRNLMSVIFFLNNVEFFIVLIFSYKKRNNKFIQPSRMSTILS